MDRFTNAFGIILFGLIVSGCASDSMMESSGSGTSTSGGGTAVSSPTNAPSSTNTPSSTTASKSTKDMDRVASGAVEDTLNACLARIPQDASAGQKMLAEESCRRDEARR